MVRQDAPYKYHRQSGYELVKERSRKLDPEAAEQIKEVMLRRRQELQVRGGGPRALAGSLQEVIASRKIGRVLESRELTQLWCSCVDEEIAQRTKILSLRNRILLVEVADSVLMSELASFHRRNILNTIKKHRPDMDVKNVKFRLNARLGKKNE
ncbi:MAG TPA: hypothetical protein DIW81_10190 [Planctomycetaceae bacterium]|nr:hypothetical protein [Rubinisphaera sp.]HCS51945.1 hypothetical protein [Planctomycetaceae bacterium]|tara:strand:- start:16859 stop:17320 length:462 start_codon:yes stop_codon:yes gene_type:complete